VVKDLGRKVVQDLPAGTDLIKSESPAKMLFRTLASDVGEWLH